MRIDNLRTERVGDRPRVSATVIWEECNRPAQDIYFETTDPFATYLTCSPNAFLLAGLLPAMHYGEKRIAVEGPLSRELRDGVLTAMELLRFWYKDELTPIEIEAPAEARRPNSSRPDCAGSFLSGGIDSLALLRTNRLNFPRDHPAAIQICLVVHGFDIGARQNSDSEIAIFDRAFASSSAVTQEAQVTLIPVLTNIRHLNDDVPFWMYKLHGAALAAVAHAFAERLTRVYIAASYSIPFLVPWGSHPLLDPFYSSTELQIRHDGIRYSRLDKVKIVSEWDIALQNVRVCFTNSSEQLNCGRCEKCVRTMLELTALGKLDRTRAFPATHISPEMLDEILPLDALRHLRDEYSELIEPLREMGRLDLAEVLTVKFAQLDKKGWKDGVRGFDQRYLGNNLSRTYRMLKRQMGALVC